MKNSFHFGGLFALLLVFAACDSGGSADADSNDDTELKDSELAEMSDLVVSLSMICRSAPMRAEVRPLT
jgi:hypothetical protein